ncbi:hypothetical protein [Pseudomonas versuta]|uniref:hypothetical protein n=1 Tax=Pseudomonas TaxID=286 RepID=UPI000F7A50C8|nr:hypothetical protein [Pseudomonas versuta]
MDAMARSSLPLSVADPGITPYDPLSGTFYTSTFITINVLKAKVQRVQTSAIIITPAPLKSAEHDMSAPHHKNKNHLKKQKLITLMAT